MQLAIQKVNEEKSNNSPHFICKQSPERTLNPLLSIKEKKIMKTGSAMVNHDENWESAIVNHDENWEKSHGESWRKIGECHDESDK